MKQDALIVIDVQKALVDAHPWQESTVLGNINRLIAGCRAAGIPVVFVQHDEDEGDLVRGSEGWQITPQLERLATDKHIEKRFGSAFRQTDLHTYLQSIQAKNILLCGMQTEYCVDTTCKVAFELGYSVTLPVNGTTTFDNRLFKASDLVRYYENYIWRGNLARTLPMDALTAEMNNR